MNDLICKVGQTMSSLEIAELTGKRHDHVLRDVKSLIEQGAINAPSFGVVKYKDKKGENRPMYSLDFDATLTLITGYDAVLRSRVIKRWHELEDTKKSTTVYIPQTYPEALRAYANEVEQKELAIAQRDRAVKTKAEIGSRREATAMSTASVAVKKVVRLEKILERHDCKTMTELLEDTAISARVANIELETLGYLYTEVVNGKKRKRLTEKGEEIAKEFPSKKFIQIGVLPGSEDRVIDMILGR